MFVCVVGGVAVEIAAMDDACPVACEEGRVDDSWIGLQGHVAVEAIDEDACGLGALVVEVNLFFNDGG